MRYYRVLKPFLLLGLLYVSVVWVLRSRHSDVAVLAMMIVGVPGAVAVYLNFKTEEAAQALQIGLEVTIHVGHLTPKPLRAHPYFREAHQAAQDKYEEMKSQGRPGEWDHLRSSGIGTSFRFMYKSGLVWSEPRKTFVNRAFVVGRTMGDVLGDTKTEAANIEPSLMVVESHGIIGVLLIPVQTEVPFIQTRREASEMRAFNVFDREKREQLLKRNRRKTRQPEGPDEYSTPGDPPAAVLGEFPVAAFREMVAMPDGAMSYSAFGKAWDALGRQYGLSAPKSDPEFSSDSFELQTEYVRFVFDPTGPV